MRGYEGAKRLANPEFQKKELMESDLFGEVPIHDEADRQAAEAYAAVLRERLSELTSGKMPESERARLLERGLRMVEGLWGKEQGIEPEKDLLRDIRRGVRQGLEITPEHEEDLQVFSTVKHPLQALGIAGFARINIRGRKLAYITFGYKEDARAGLDIADIPIGDMPDAEDDPKAYEREQARIARAVIGQYRRKTAGADHPAQQRKGGHRGGKF